MSKLLDKYINQYVKSLADDGEKILRSAANTNDTTPRSKNMMDAYGCAVFYDGKIMEKRYVNNTPQSTKPHKGWEKNNIPSATGRDYLEDFFMKYKPKSDGFVMICVNVIYYTSILENGAQHRPKVPLSRKYRIISQMDSDFQKLTSKYYLSSAETLLL